MKKKKTIEIKKINFEVNSFKDIGRDNNSKFSTIEIDNYGTINILEFPRIELSKLMNEIENKKFDEQRKMISQIIYIGIPMLKDRELMKVFDCKDEPYKIVEKIFTDIEINYILDQIVKFSERKIVNS